MSDRRKMLTEPNRQVEIPSVLLGNGLNLLPLVPAEIVQRSPDQLHLIACARLIRDVARWRFRELIGSGHASWQHPRVDVPPAIRRAGEKLAKELTS